MNLLIVDDHPTNLKLLRAQLEAEDHAVVEAHDGVDALALLERQRVDGVISDILMPRMDGYRLCYEIRKHARLRDLPVIIYTSTYTSPSDEKLALDMGADKYLKKPASVETLVAALHEVIAMPHAAPRPKALQEVDVLKEYSERLVFKLEEKNMRLQSLSRRLLNIQETERRSLARELHDEIGQALTATKINLQALERFPDPATLASRLRDANSIVERALEQVRSLSLELRPPLLDDLGLPAALRWLLDQHARRSGLQVQFVSDPFEGRPGAEVETACFRIAQQGLMNVVKHAGARTVRVELRRVGDALHLHVRDDGAGFDVLAARARAMRGESLGLLSMEERAALAGGGIEWTPAPGRGTDVHAWFALAPTTRP